MSWTVIRTASAPPSPWETGWHVEPLDDDVPGIVRHHVARAPAGTPVPPGAHVVDEGRTAPADDITVEAMRVHLLVLVDDDDDLAADIARGDLADEDDMRERARRATGVSHPYAWLAPAGWSLDQSCQAHTSAELLWTSPCSCGVVRAAPHGYQIWTGIGSLMQPAGVCIDVEAAEACLLESVLAHRDETLAEIRNGILDGWPDRTPYYSATLGTAREALPLSIRRGPMTGKELPVPVPGELGQRGDTIPASSWDLPVVAVWRDGAWTRYPERVTWDDEESRQRQRDREAAGKAAREAEERRACELLRPAIPDRIAADGRQLVGGHLATRVGDVHVMGPVRMREDGQVAQALVRYQGRRVWAAIGEWVESQEKSR